MIKLPLFILQVAFDTCSVLTAEAAEAYGLFWTPLVRPATLQLPVTSAAPARPGCFWYKVGGWGAAAINGSCKRCSHSCT
jgi:hypothetical protein